LAEKQFIQITNKSYSYFVYGFASACLIWAFFPSSEITPLNEDKNLIRIDSIKSALNAKNDSLNIVLDSLTAIPIQTETIYIQLNDKIQNHYATTDTFTNSDSLTNVIKRSIQLGRIEGNPKLSD
jgi:hypothetical protein